MRMSTAGFTGRTDLSGAVLGETETSRRETAVDFGRYLPLFWLQPHVRDMQLDQLRSSDILDRMLYRKELVKTAGFFPSFSLFSFMTEWPDEGKSEAQQPKETVNLSIFWISSATKTEPGSV